MAKNPSSAPRRDALSEAAQLLREERVDEAERIYREILKQKPEDPTALHYLGVIASGRGAHEAALDLMKRSVALDPDRPEFQHNVAAIYKIQGRFEDAERCYRRSLELKPDYAEAWFNYSSVRKFTAGGSEIDTIESSLDQPNLSDEDRCFLHFAGGKICDDRGEFDRAFGHYTRGNAARQTRFDLDRNDAFIDRIIATFDSELMATRSGEGFSEASPIFVLGMPRSGSTLLEQILASHPALTAGGELPDIRGIAYTLPKHSPEELPYPACVPALNQKALRGFGEAYAKRVQSLYPSRVRVVDKMPGNFLHLGLIRLLLPNATIIHCRRDPIDTCLSCYFQRFRTGHEYSYDLDDLVRYYRAYRRLMEHWHAVLPGEVLDVEYEDMVSDQEATTRSLLAFCREDWDEACLHFHDTERPVTTASSWQVRRPLFRSGLRRWENYRAHVDVLREGLA